MVSFCDAGAVVAVEEQPLCRHPLRGAHLLQPGASSACCDSSPAARSSPGLRSATISSRSATRFSACRRATRRRGDLAAGSLVLVVVSGVGPRAPGPRRRGRLVTDAIITADHLSKWYGQVIGLNDVTLSVPPGITGAARAERRGQEHVHEAHHRAAASPARASMTCSASRSGAIPRCISASASVPSRMRSTSG